MVEKQNHENMKEKIVFEFSKTLQIFGLSQLEARLFAHLYLSDKPLTLDEMSEALGNSKTAVSTNIRSLLEMNLVTRVWKKGFRKDLYETNSHLYRSFINFYADKWADLTTNQIEQLELLGDRMKQFPDESRHLLKDLKEILIFHRQLEGMLNKIKVD